MSPLPHWPATDLYPVRVVGVSFYRDAIWALADNPSGTLACVMCCAHLVPYDDNSSDPNAVRVEIDGKVVGHLSRDFAVPYRSRLAQISLEARTTTCDGLITNGLSVPDRACNYTIELDLDIAGVASLKSLPRYPELIRKDPKTHLSRRPNGSYVATVWLGPEALGNLHKRLQTTSWTTDHWTTINYYIENRQACGLGHRVLSIPKDEHFLMFGDEEPEVFVERIEGRYATVVMRPANTNLCGSMTDDVQFTAVPEAPDLSPPPHTSENPTPARLSSTVQSHEAVRAPKSAGCLFAAIAVLVGVGGTVGGFAAIAWHFI